MRNLSNLSFQPIISINKNSSLKYENLLPEDNRKHIMISKNQTFMVEIKESEDIKFEHLERNPSDFLEGLEGVSSKKKWQLCNSL
jgi:hypothetical protein